MLQPISETLLTDGSIQYEALRDLNNNLLRLLNRVSKHRLPSRSVQTSTTSLLTHKIVERQDSSKLNKDWSSKDSEHNEIKLNTSYNIRSTENSQLFQEGFHQLPFTHRKPLDLYNFPPEFNKTYHQPQNSKYPSFANTYSFNNSKQQQVPFGNGQKPVSRDNSSMKERSWQQHYQQKVQSKQRKYPWQGNQPLNRSKKQNNHPIDKQRRDKQYKQFSNDRFYYGKRIFS